jgi:hypothetical protein
MLNVISMRWARWLHRKRRFPLVFDRIAKSYSSLRW